MIPFTETFTETRDEYAEHYIPEAKKHATGQPYSWYLWQSDRNHRIAVERHLSNGGKVAPEALKPYHDLRGVE